MKGLSITQDSLEIMNLFVEKIVINKDIELPAEIYAADQATKLAIEKNIPFRDAYREVGSNGEYKKVLTKKETIGAADNLSLDKIKNKWKHKS